jgi:hypothetical protein
VTIVLVPDVAFNGGPAKSMLRRNGGPGVNGRPIIFLRESVATCEELAYAYAGLIALMQRDADANAYSDENVQVGIKRIPATQPWADDLIQRLKQRAPANVPGHGSFRSIRTIE